MPRPHSLANEKVADMTTDHILTDSVPKEDPASPQLGQYDREADPVLAMNANRPGVGPKKAMR